MSSPPPSATPKKRLSGRLPGPGSEPPLPPAGPPPAPPAGPAGDPGPAIYNRADLALDRSLQVADPDRANMDVNGLPLLASLNKSGVDDQFAQMLPARAAVDWRPNRPAANRTARTGMPLRAVIGQLCGHQAPAGHECGNCSKGNGPFVHCRVVLFPDASQSPIQWDWACAGCSYSSGGNKCSFRPATGTPPMWLIDLVRAHNPSNPSLKHPNVLALVAQATAAVPVTPAKAKKDKGKGCADGKDLSGDGGKVVAGPRKKAKTTATVAKKKYPDVPARRDEAPVPGPAYNGVWYHSPLAEPGVAHLSDVPGAVRSYAELKEVRTRLEFDLRLMKKVLVTAGHIEDSGEDDDGSEYEEEEDSDASVGVFVALE